MKRIYATPSVKYLVVKIDENLSWHRHINDLTAKLNRANALLKFVSTIFYQIFIFSPIGSTSKTMKSVFYFI